MTEMRKDVRCQGLTLMSGGLDSQLAVRILERAGAAVEAVAFSAEPFFGTSRAETAAAALGVRLHVLDFLEEIVTLLESPPHGFGGALNPCIDCHAAMICRAGALMRELGFDFVATGEVRGQRPMSQNAQSLVTVEKASGLAGRLVRPLSALLLEPTEVEKDGRLDRTRLCDLSGRGRERQIVLAQEFGIVDYPAPAGGCRLTETAFARKVADLRDHEGLRVIPGGAVNRPLVALLAVGRHFRLPDGTGLIVGRDARENERLAAEAAAGLGTFVDTGNVPGPTSLLVGGTKSAADQRLAQRITEAYARGRTNDDRAFCRPWHVASAGTGGAS